MDFRFSPEEEAFRQELRTWLEENVPADWEGVFLEEEEEPWREGRAFVKRLAQKGWVAPGWPKEYGGMEASPSLQLVYNEEMGYHRAPIGSIVQSVGYIGPAILGFGTEEQKKMHLPPISAGETVWCQGFSEPNAGSDLASLQCRAVKDGDDWVINGDKTWTSNAHRSEWCIVLARTDPGAPKHKGISFFLVEMKTPGITVMPVVNAADVHSFNEVFFEDVRVPKNALLGAGEPGLVHRRHDPRLRAVQPGGRRRGHGQARPGRPRRLLQGDQSQRQEPHGQPAGAPQAGGDGHRDRGGASTWSTGWCPCRRARSRAASRRRCASCTTPRWTCGWPTPGSRSWGCSGSSTAIPSGRG